MAIKDMTSGGKLPMITLWQPWAMWIILGWKTIETRTHNHFRCLAGKTVGIHAGLHWDKNALQLAAPYLNRAQLEFSNEACRVHGRLLGTVFVARHRLLTRSDSQSALIYCGGTGNPARWGLIIEGRPDRWPPCNIMKGTRGITYLDLRQFSGG